MLNNNKLKISTKDSLNLKKDKIKKELIDLIKTIVIAVICVNKNYCYSCYMCFYYY